MAAAAASILLEGVGGVGGGEVGGGDVRVVRWDVDTLRTMGEVGNREVEGGGGGGGHG